ncbi:EI24 domain-containing protein [Qipengyuania sp. ASV99]|uniref:EI24 domain-containing protein n=1 Tax=Qipengyuania sp. ASV99 TaxID=3399681 RepID=UPI003A4C76BD
MKAVLISLGRAIGQLADRAVLGVLAKTVLVTLLVFAAMGVGLWAALVAGFEAAGLSGGGFASATAAVLIAAVAAWLLFRVVALAVLQFFADEIVAAVEVKHYPARARQARSLPFRRDLANALRGIGRTVAVNALALPVALVLLVTGVGAALVFLSVNAWLLGRELTDMAWLRHCEGEAAAKSPVPRAERLMLGGVVTAIMLVPFVNLLAPILGAAAGTHLAHDAMTRQDEREKGDWLA